MNKKLWISFIVVFILMGVLNFIIHGVILAPTYQSDQMKNIWRVDMESKMWIYYIVFIFISFFFVLIYSKWQKGKGISEGIQYGTYAGLMMSVPMAYSTYAMIPLSYSVAFQWFIYGLIEYIILGIVTAMIFGKKPADTV